MLSLLILVGRRDLVRVRFVPATGLNVDVGVVFVVVGVFVVVLGGGVVVVVVVFGDGVDVVFVAFVVFMEVLLLSACFL